MSPDEDPGLSSSSRSSEEYPGVVCLRSRMALAAPLSAGLLKGNFNGLDTNFKILEGLVDYYDQIDTMLGGVENKEIREFLKCGDRELILALPKINSDHSIRKSIYVNLDALCARANQIKVNHEKIKGYIQNLEELVSIFVDHKNIDVSLLSVSGKMLREFTAKYKSLDEKYLAVAFYVMCFGFLGLFRCEGGTVFFRSIFSPEAATFETPAFQEIRSQFRRSSVMKYL